MLCEKCDNSDVLYHLAEVPDDIQNEMYFCMKCKKNLQINHSQPNNAFSFNNEGSDCDAGIKCINCGLTSPELIYDGRPGCPSCYKYFNSVFGSVSKNSNEKKYTGKKPSNYVEILNNKNAIPEINNNYFDLLDTKYKLEEKLKMAVIEERYEDAAILRDKIKEVIESE
jgi:protein arginine kinase activator